MMKTAAIVAAAGALLFSGMAKAAEIKVLSTQATQQAYLELVEQFEKATGHKVATVFTGTLNVQKRLADGEAYDPSSWRARRSTSRSGSARPSPAAASISRNPAPGSRCAKAPRSPIS